MPDNDFKFSFGPWNIFSGADPFGPPVRGELDFSDKLKFFRTNGFDAVMLHDDDAIPGLMDMPVDQVRKRAREFANVIEGEGLEVELMAPRLWEAIETVDGAYTSNRESDRRYASDRSMRCLEVMHEVGCKLMVMWYAREGTYMREAKDAAVANRRLREGLNEVLDADPEVRIAIEPKPNEPMDHAFIPTIGHALALGATCSDPSRVGCLVESAHAILAGLDPSDEMAFALEQNKLWSVHLNDQNGLKYDQDKVFGAVDLRRAYNQVRVLLRHDYGKDGAMIAFDVKSLRTQAAPAIDHLINSRHLFLRLVDKAESIDEAREQEYIDRRDYEGLERYVLDHLLG